jgi:4-nitrophenyl phosphatase
MLADDYDCLLFDLDGVLYRGDAVVPGAPETLDELRRCPTGLPDEQLLDPPSRWRTSSRARDRRERRRGVVTSALATAELLAERGGGRAFVLGQEGVRRALADAGIEVLDGEPERADLVVVGFDGDVTYDRLKAACLLVQRGARLVATNPDASYPAADGLWPGAGALLAVITTTTGAEPEIVGKPYAPLFEAARRRGGGGRPLVIGDRLDTDIEGAVRLGWDCMLVLTGVSTRHEAETTGPHPTFVVDDVSALLGRADT